MSFRWLLAVLTLVPWFAWHTPAAMAQDGYDEAYDDQGETGDFSMFYDSLSPYGDWYYTPEYGYVWMPWVEHADWRPYANDGHWVWSDYGWTWVSDYEWGWAPFHYGRWIWLDSVWVWIPDLEWGPAWVAWRYTDTYVGWAPLAPGAYWYPDYGLDMTVSIPWAWWVFVPGSRVLDIHVYHHHVPYARTSRIYHASRPATVYRVQGGVPVCVGIDIHRVARWTGAPVRQVRVSVTARNAGRTTVTRGAVVVYRPPARSVSVRRMSAPPPPRRAAPAVLSRVTAPPPPSRAGVAPSQAYKARATVERKAVERKAAPSMNRAVEQRKDVERERRDVQQGREEIQRDRQEIQRDRREQNDNRRELREDKRELKQNQRTQPQNTEQLKRDAAEVERSRKEVEHQRRETKEDKRELQRDRQEQQRDRQDVVRERRERNN